jgi:hypothetical protein
LEALQRSGGQLGWQQYGFGESMRQTSEVAQLLGVAQTPPQPSLAPQLLPSQLGAQQAPFGWQVAPCGQPHTPPQPSLASQPLPSQLGLQHAALGPSPVQVSP